ncbi:hypothetical protein ACN20G_35560 (plasmid) [Streptomyces sp. BI20]|uniref:hypothetical protein n=1 Tax=Streptomyces sp. BI20 TaxID=3403460 RepID=UPI003C786A6E
MNAILYPVLALAGVALLVVLGRLLVRDRARRTALLPTGVPGMARRPAGTGRWRPGLVAPGPDGALRWIPDRGPATDLPPQVHWDPRTPTVREGITINPGSRVLRCAPAADPTTEQWELAVMPLDLRALTTLIPPKPDA